MIDFDLLDTCFERTAGRVRYRLGAKAPHVMCGSDEIHEIDCSGFTRWILARASVGSLILPDGSLQQLAAVQERRWRKLAQYSDVHYARNDGSRLFIAFLTPPPRASWPRHVWLLRCGRTLESCGRRGVCSRPWDHQSIRRAQWCFEVPTG